MGMNLMTEIEERGDGAGFDEEREGEVVGGDSGAEHSDVEMDG